MLRMHVDRSFTNAELQWAPYKAPCQSKRSCLNLDSAVQDNERCVLCLLNLAQKPPFLSVSDFKMSKSILTYSNRIREH